MRLGVDTETKDTKVSVCNPSDLFQTKMSQHVKNLEGGRPGRAQRNVSEEKTRQVFGAESLHKQTA